MNNICNKCKYLKHRKWNLFKKDKQRPRIYTVECGMAPVSCVEGFECRFFAKK